MSSVQLRLVGLAVLLGAVGGALGTLLLGQDGGFDLKNYHWYNPHALLNGRLEQDILVAQLQSYFNPALDLPFYLAVEQFGPKAGSMLLGAVHGLNFSLVVLLASKLLPSGGPRGGFPRPPVLWFLCGVVGCWGPIFVADLGGSRGDTTTSLFVLAALLCLLRRAGPAFVLSGLAMGIGWGLKLTVGVYVAGGLAALVLVGLDGPRGRFQSALRWCFGVFAGLLASFGPWSVHLVRSYENPVFPFANQFFRSPYALPVDFSERRFHPEGVVESILFPLKFASGGEVAWTFAYRDLRFGLLYVLVGVAVALWLWRRRTGSLEVAASEDRRPLAFVLCFTVLSYVAWQWGFCVYRYLAALELLAPTVIVVLVARLGTSRVWTPLMQLSLLLLIVVFVRVPEVERLPWEEDLFQVEVPPVRGAGVVVLAGDDATSYLVPSFPAELRFVRIQSNLSFPDDETRLNELMRAVVTREEGPLYFIKGPHPIDHESLRTFGLRIVEGSCRAIVSRVDSGLALCDLMRD
ncbi:MAG: hypothetical protein CL928_11350 [Deltaproteobacteria bacterium]|nr:hypothetical protein [Deltaproteobacteria bacterium]